VACRVGRARPGPIEGKQISARAGQNRVGAPGTKPQRGVSQNQKTTLLVNSWLRAGATGVKVDGRKSHAEARPEVVKRAQDLAQPKGQRGPSLRAISKALAAEGHLNERGKPFAAKSVASMLASQRKAGARRRAPRRPTAPRPSPG
jgi:hypothetical protein